MHMLLNTEYDHMHVTQQYSLSTHEDVMAQLLEEIPILEVSFIHK